MLDRLASSLQGDGRGGGPVAGVLNAGYDVVNGNGQHLKEAFDELSKALRLSADRGVHTREQMTAIIENLSSLLDAAAKNDSTLRQFGSTVRQLSQIMANEGFGSGTSGQQLNALIQRTGDILNANREAIARGIANGNTTIQSVVDRQRRSPSSSMCCR